MDALLDRFIPVWDVVERHEVRVSAPADVTLAAARSFDLIGRPLVRAIFRAREVLLGSKPGGRAAAHGLLDATLAMGWVVLDEVPGRELVVGAVTKPWEADVTFRSVPPGSFAAFDEPDFVKIVWTLRADPVDTGTCVFRTETRAVATDEAARKRFRRYWLLARPGISLIRWLALGPVKAEAERNWRLLCGRSLAGLDA